MTHKLVVRLLSESLELLGWTEVHAVAKGDGTLRNLSAVGLMVEAAGVARYVSTHWCDLNVETRVEFTEPVAVGQWIPLWEPGSPIVCVGVAASGLPPVTVRTPIRAMPATGNLATVGQR